MWPAEGRFVDAEFVRTGSSLSIAEMIQSGTTFVNDMYFFPNVTAEIVDQVGFKAAIGLPILPFPTRWASNVDEYFSKVIRLHLATTLTLQSGNGSSGKVSQSRSNPRFSLSSCTIHWYPITSPTPPRLPFQLEFNLK